MPTAIAGWACTSPRSCIASEAAATLEAPGAEGHHAIRYRRDGLRDLRQYPVDRLQCAGAAIGLRFGLCRLHADALCHRGFTVIDASGHNPIIAVRIVYDTIVELTLTRQPTGTTYVRYADATYHGGAGNLRDSDPFVATENYVYSSGSGQQSAANIAGLVGNPYPLFNWCIAFNQQIQRTSRRFAGQTSSHAERSSRRPAAGKRKPHDHQDRGHHGLLQIRRHGPRTPRHMRICRSCTSTAARSQTRRSHWAPGGASAVVEGSAPAYDAQSLTTVGNQASYLQTSMAGFEPHHADFGGEGAGECI